MKSGSSVGVRVHGDIITVTLVALAACAWWLTTLMTRASSEGMQDPMQGTMAMASLGTFLLAWALMMAAMMLPAVTPVVRLYQRAAAVGRVAPTGWFVTAYLAVWMLTGLPAFLLWRLVAMPVGEESTWALRLGGATLVSAGVYQLTGLKRACLRHCRSPMSYFMRLRGSLGTPGGAFRAGALHATYCCGCCVALMIVLVVSAAMSLWWALLLAVGIFIERNVRWGMQFATGLGVTLLALGAAAVVSPMLLTHVI